VVLVKLSNILRNRERSAASSQSSDGDGGWFDKHAYKYRKTRTIEVPHKPNKSTSEILASSRRIYVYGMESPRHKFSGKK
jgi:hypothetical protein